MSCVSRRRAHAGVLGRHGWWLGAGAAALALAGIALGYRLQGPTATVLLARNAPESTAAAPQHRPEADTGFDAAGVLMDRSCLDSIAQQAAAALGRPVARMRLQEIAAPAAARAHGILRLRLSAGDAEQTVGLANACAEEAVRVVTDWRRRQLEDVKHQAGRRLAALDRELEATSSALLHLQQDAGGVPFDQTPVDFIRSRTEMDAKVQALGLELADLDRRADGLQTEIQRLAPDMVKAREALAQARTRFTEQHPRVIELRAALAALETRLMEHRLPEEPDVVAWGSPVAMTLHAQLTDLRRQKVSLLQQLETLTVRGCRAGAGLGQLPARHAAYVRLQSKYDALKKEQLALASRQQHLESQQELAPLQIVRRAEIRSLDDADRHRAALALGGVGGLLGLLMGAGGILLLEAADGRVRRAEDLAEATGLPVLGTLDDLHRMDSRQQLLWALHTLTMIRSRIPSRSAGGLVWGVASLKAGEGRSTLIRLLAKAAATQGLKVLTVEQGGPGRAHARVTGESPGENPLPNPIEEVFGKPSPLPSPLPAGEPKDAFGEAEAGQWPSRGSVDSEGAAGRGTDNAPEGLLPKAGALQHLTWDMALRDRWPQALAEWSERDRCLVLVELPPLSTPEAFVMAGKVPHLLWVTRRHAIRQAELRSHMKVLRRLETCWLGAVFNRARTAWRPGFHPGVAGLILWTAALAWPLRAPAAPQETQPGPEAPANAAPTELAGSFTISGPHQLADWQKRLTLGPGDTFNIQLYEQPDTIKAGLFIGPDGRLSYLEARDVVAAGLTVDELRTKLEEVLGKYRLSPRVIIYPVTYASKKYYLLGHVNRKGLFPLDRPVTIIEAIAQAGGFVISQQHRHTLVQADMGRSFLVRRGADGKFGRVGVDFEGLFQRGDLSQNLALAPDDYLFFPPIDLQEVYVLGAVARPGLTPYTKDMTVLGAIVAHGGFAPRAYRSRVLVVRGSLNRPQTFVVDTADILAARAPDFALSNRDIVFVHRRPFAKAEELLEGVLLTFARSFATAYAQYQIDPLITDPWVE
ncbi:MAG: SLBB domain-containing protein [Verrucomicrobia bacterium]|nr:SLBB domain-containing protein [Verrucomicrobiota bacterium]